MGALVPRRAGHYALTPISTLGLSYGIDLPEEGQIQNVAEGVSIIASGPEPPAFGWITPGVLAESATDAVGTANDETFRVKSDEPFDCSRQWRFIREER